jgi:LysR family glycine cleavage system transcriptional activator
MFRQLPPLKALRAFEAAARHGSFTEAAKELSLTQGAISYQVRQLESKLEIDLFQRSARLVTLTGSGQSLYRTVHRLFRELEDEINSISPGREPLILTISVSTYFVTRWLSARLGNFLNNHPDITLRLQHSVNDPDFTLEDVDLAIRWGRGGWENSEAEMLIPSPMIAVCSPQLMKGENALGNLDDVSRQTLLHDQEGSDCWQEWLLKAGLDNIGSGRGPVIVDPNVRVQSAIDGHGLVLADNLIRDDLAAGRLVAPFEISLDGFGFHLLYSRDAGRRHAFRLFRQWLLDETDSFNNCQVDAT